MAARSMKVDAQAKEEGQPAALSTSELGQQARCFRPASFAPGCGKGGDGSDGSLFMDGWRRVFFSRVRRRAVYLCIKKNRIVQITTRASRAHAHGSVFIGITFWKQITGGLWP